MNYDERKAWAATVKAGDEVAMETGAHYSRNYRIFKVDRVTKTQIVTDCCRRFRREDARLIGSGYAHIEPVTDAVRTAVEHNDLANWFGRLSLGHKVPPLHALRAMKTAYDGAMAEWGAPTVTRT